MTQLARIVEDVQTELLIQTFADRILLLITQVGKVGNLIQASIPPTAPLLPASHATATSDSERADGISAEPTQSLPSPPPSIQLTPLLGSGPSEQIQTLHSLYASQAATLVWLSAEGHGGERKPVVVGIALMKAHVWDEAKERKTFLGVMNMVGELLTRQSR
ncbi:hypothetical protein JB92DRAFT_3083474 [Gautieria morchelliformis]|nr:hypothetical protein JB92DRAFT_3083474 [Gautieria morchelliformis]